MAYFGSQLENAIHYCVEGMEQKQGVADGPHCIHSGAEAGGS